MGEFRMPSLGADMEEGKILEWRVGPGDEVHRGDIVATVDTSKAEIDVEIFEDGIVQELLVPVGETVAVGAPLARVGSGAAPAPAPAPALAEPAVAPEPEPEPEPEPVPVRVIAAPVSGNGHRPRITPLARRVAQDLGVDLATLSGTGPHGAICRADVERAAGLAEAPAPAPAEAPTARAPASDRSAAMRESIAGLMARSKREIPHYYLAVDIDLRNALDWLERHNRDRSLLDRVVPAALLLRATAKAAATFRDLNGFFADGSFRPAERVNVGVAIALRGGGLVAPAIHDADTKPVDELMTDLRDLVHRARVGGLRGSEMADPTITVTNLGDQGVPAVYGVIYPPQVALVGFGVIGERPWAVDGMLAVRPVVTATLSADHRVTDGHRGGLFLAELDRLLQAPEDL